MAMRNGLLKVTALAASATLSAANAHATIIDLNLTVASIGPTYSQDGYTLTCSPGNSSCFGNWILNGDAGFNANGSNPTIFTNTAATTTTLTKDGGGSFDFTSIELADIYNGTSGGQVTFNFNFLGGATSSQTVTLAQTSGLQNFVFDQLGLTSVSWVPVTTNGRFVQFDFLNVTGDAVSPGVPEPATWAMMLLGFGFVGFAMRRMQRQAVRFNFA
jgi:hypothetical protein